MRGGTRAKNWIAAAALAGFLGATGASAEQVQFKTMEMRTMAGLDEPVFVQVAAKRKHARRYAVKRRSKKKSAAIVGGTAATGAAIGALAGGGKGAAIGAIAGGGAGYVYDRKTHKKTVRVQ